MACQQPARGGLGVVDLADPLAIAASALANATEVETQGRQAGIAGAALQSGDHLVLHGAGEQRVRMADQGDAAGIGQIEVQGFQRPAGAIDGYRDFAGRQTGTP